MSLGLRGRAKLKVRSSHKKLCSKILLRLMRSRVLPDFFQAVCAKKAWNELYCRFAQLKKNSRTQDPVLKMICNFAVAQTSPRALSRHYAMGWNKTQMS